MKQKNYFSRWLICLLLLVLISIVAVNAADLSDCTFIDTPVQEALRTISIRFGVTIIADPSLPGVVNATIHGDSSIEEVLQVITEPLGYSFNKIENYYLVSDGKTPYTIFAETDSCLVPVGFLNPDVQAKLDDYQQYFTYDRDLGVAFVKAPTSILNKILSKLWELSASANQLTIVYNLQIVDLGSSRDLDSLFIISYDDGRSDKGDIIVTPDELSTESKILLTLRNKIGQSSFSMAKQPWLMTLPGRTVEMKSNIHIISDTDHNYDRDFTIRITALKVDEPTGKVLSEVYIGKEENTISRVSTTVRTSPGAHEIVAVIRQTRQRPSRSLWGKRTILEHRDFAVLMTATPINIQTTLAKNSGIIPIASLGGIDRLSDSQPVGIKPKSSIIFGLVDNKEYSNNAWLELNVPFGEQVTMKLDYRNSDLNSLGFSWELEPEGGTYLDLTGGQGIGPDGQNAVMLGIGDQVQVSKYFSLFGAYYPGAYLIDTEEYITDRGVWNAGARLEFGKLGLTVKAFGNPDYEGLRLKMDLAAKKHTYIFEASNIEKEETVLYLGVGFNF